MNINTLFGFSYALGGAVMCIKFIKELESIPFGTKGFGLIAASGIFIIPSSIYLIYQGINQIIPRQRIPEPGIIGEEIVPNEEIPFPDLPIWNEH